MIVSFLLNLFGGVIAWLLGLLPHLSPPSWLDDAAGALSTVLSSLNGSSAWVPWSYLLLGVGLVLSSVAVAVAIRGFRIVASFLTLGGGS